MGERIRKKDNRGMTLVEIIIVLALMTVIAGMAGYGLSLVSNKPVQECTKKVEMALNRNRTNSMGKKEAWVEFFIENGRVTVLEHTLSGRTGAAPQETKSVIGDKDVNMRPTYSDGSVALLDGTHRRIAFARDSGALVGNEVGVVCTKIEIFKGAYSSAGYKQTIVLETLTGKVRIVPASAP